MDADYVDQLVKRGLISDDVAARLTGGEPQRQSRFDILRQGLDAAKDYLTPGYFRDTPSSPQADRALADPSARPGKIGPPSGPPTGMQIAGGLAGDVGLNALPLGKLATIPFWIKTPAKAARADELIARGLGRQAIADDLDVGKAAVGRYLGLKGQKTAAAENPSHWDAPENLEGLKADLAQGLSFEKIAAKQGTTPGNVSGKAYRLQAAGELKLVPREPSIYETPERLDRLEQLARSGLSVREMARDKQLGAKGPGQVSRWIDEMQARYGRLTDYAPQGTGATGLRAAGKPKTPTLPQLKSQGRPLTPEDLEASRDFARALSAFTNSQSR